MDAQFCWYDRRAPSIARRPASSSATSSTVRPLAGSLRGPPRLGLDEPPEITFRLGSGDAVALASATNLPDLLVDETPRWDSAGYGGCSWPELNRVALSLDPVVRPDRVVTRRGVPAAPHGGIASISRVSQARDHLAQSAPPCSQAGRVALGAQCRSMDPFTRRAVLRRGRRFCGRCSRRDRFCANPETLTTL
jgi:hypothetical protein